MNEILGAVDYRNVTQNEVLRIGSGDIAGFIVGSHSSGKIKLYDGFDSVLAVKASSTLTVSSGLPPAKFAKSILTSDATQPTAGDTVTIGAVVYTFQSTLALAYDVKIGASVTATLLSLLKAINGTGVAGTDYFAGTVAHPLVIASASDATTVTVYSRTYGTGNNTLATTEASTHLAWEATTLGAGTGASIAGVATAGATFVINGTSYYFTTLLSETLLGTSSAVANEILWVTSDAVALDNMKLAINGTGVEGTDYATGTQTHPDVIATTNGNTTQVIEARNWGTIGNEITTTEAITGSAWTGAVLSGGVNGARLIMSEYTLATGSSVITLPRPIPFVNGLYLVISSGTADLTPIWGRNS